MVPHAQAQLACSAVSGTSYSTCNDGTVYDIGSNLYWDQCSLGQTGSDCSGNTATTYTWPDASTAAAAAAQSNYKNQNIWRLPTITELCEFLQNNNCNGSDYVTTTLFPNLQNTYGPAYPSYSGAYVWSSTVCDPTTTFCQEQDCVTTVCPWGAILAYANNGFAPSFSFITLTDDELNVQLARNGPLVSALSAASIMPTSAVLNATTNLVGTGYFVVLPSGSAAPMVVNGSPGICTTASSPNSIESGSGATSVGASTFNLAGLAPATAYDVYFLASDANCAPSLLNGPVTFTTLGADTTTTITNSSPISAIYGSSATINVNIVRNADQAVPNDGSVVCTLTNTGNGTTIATPAATVSSGIAMCGVLATLDAGSYSVTATYTPGSGDNDFLASASTTATLTIAQAQQAISFTAPPTQVYSARGTFPINGSASSGLTVSFGSQTPAVCSVSGDTVTMISAGVCTIIAAQTGNIDYAAAAAITQSIQIGSAPSGITLSSSISPSVFGQSVTFTATVSGQSPAGTISFSAGSNSICTAAPLNGSTNTATATCTINTLPAGPTTINASYSGDNNNLPNMATLAQVVDPAATAIMITPASASIAQGSSIVINASVAVVAPGGGTPTGTILISDGGSGAGDQCTVVLPATNCTLTPTGSGSLTLTANYITDVASTGDFIDSSASTILSIVTQPTKSVPTPALSMLMLIFCAALVAAVGVGGIRRNR